MKWLFVNIIIVIVDSGYLLYFFKICQRLYFDITKVDKIIFVSIKYNISNYVLDIFLMTENEGKQNTSLVNFEKVNHLKKLSFTT